MADDHSILEKQKPNLAQRLLSEGISDQCQKTHSRAIASMGSGRRDLHSIIGRGGSPIRLLEITIVHLDKLGIVDSASHSPCHSVSFICESLGPRHSLLTCGTSEDRIAVDGLITHRRSTFQLARN